MSMFQVQQVLGATPWQSAKGGQMYSIKLAGMLDGQVESSVDINAKTPDRYQAGQVIDCTVVSRDSYGVKIKKNDPTQAPVAPALQQGFIPAAQFGQAALAAPVSQNDDRSDQIMRQHASMDALKYFEIKAASKDKKEIGEVSPGTIFRMAEIFLDYYRNGLPRSGSDVFASRNEAAPLPQFDPADDIDVNEIPF